MTTINTSLASYLTTADEKKKASGTESLSDILAPTTQAEKAKATPEDAVTLNLSDEAKELLKQASPLFTDFSGERFILNNSQRQTIESIIQSYKDAPFSDETYEAMMSDLEQAGLSPELLTIKEQVASINPVNIFLSAMNGEELNFDQLGELSPEIIEAKENNYMLDIVARWHSISTYEDPADVTPPATQVADTEES